MFKEKVLKGGGYFTFLYMALNERDFYRNPSGINKAGFRITCKEKL